MRFADDSSFAGSNLRSKTGDGSVAVRFVREIFDQAMARCASRISGVTISDGRERSARNPFRRGGLVLLRDNTPQWLLCEAFEGCGDETLRQAPALNLANSGDGFSDAIQFAI